MVSLTEWCPNKISALLVQPCTVQPVFSVFCSLCFKIWAVVFHYNQGRYYFLKHVKTEKWEAFRNEWVAVSESLCVCVWKRDRADTTASIFKASHCATGTYCITQTENAAASAQRTWAREWIWVEVEQTDKVWNSGKRMAEIEGNRTPAGLCLSITSYTIWN